MAQRVLPGAYVSLNDLSQLPEGAAALTVGYVLQADRGPVNTLKMVTSPADFLTKYTFDGKPGLESDPTFWSILKVLSRTNVMYISRAAKDPLYGGIVLKKAETLGILDKALEEVDGNDTVFKLYISGTSIDKFPVGRKLMISGTSYKDAVNVEPGKDPKDINGYCTISDTTLPGDTENSVIVTIAEKLPNGFISGDSSNAYVSLKPGVGITDIELNGITATYADGSKIAINGNLSSMLVKGCEIIIRGNALNDNPTANNGKTFKVLSIDDEENSIVVSPALEDGTDGSIYLKGTPNPDTFVTSSGDLAIGESNAMVITGIDPGKYNGDLAFEITSSIDDADMVYREGNRVGDKDCDFNTMILTVYNANTGAVLETFLFSLDPEAKDITGASLYVDNVTSGSAYIKIYHGKGTDLPSSTIPGLLVGASGGSNGDPLTEDDLITALEPFADKAVSVSILGNGCSTQAESAKFQQALMNIADTRKDLFIFLNNPTETEKKTLNSDKAQAIVDYKKASGDYGTATKPGLGNTSFYGCMYAPHVNVADIYNGRDIKVGSEAVAIAGWLGIIDSLSYPYAYAGPRNGLVQGVTCDWKIGDMSGEAQILNDASINYVAYDGKVGRYYMQCQNTLQIANSSMRNIGTVLNVLDIKEHFTTSLKEYLQLPITDALRRDIVDTANDYLSPMEGVRFYNYLFQDVSSDFDIADNTLRYLLTISPTAYAQKIYLVMNIVNATFDFSILQSL